MDWKIIFITVGSGIGWIIGECKPAFPLMIVAVILIFSDAWTAFQLDKRVHKKYPERTKRREAKFNSFEFGKVIRSTLPKRLWLIFLAFIVEHWVCVHVSIPLSYIIAGAICFEQFLSILENESSCRDEKDSKFWKMLQKILIDKTERHFDVELNDIKNKMKDIDPIDNNDL